MSGPVWQLCSIDGDMLWDAMAILAEKFDKASQMHPQKQSDYERGCTDQLELCASELREHLKGWRR